MLSQLLKLLTENPNVRIDQQCVSRLSLLQAQIRRTPIAHIPWIPDQADSTFRVSLLVIGDNGLRIIGARVIDDDNFSDGIPDGLQAFADHVATIERHHDDA